MHYSLDRFALSRPQKREEQLLILEENKEEEEVPASL